MPSDEVDRAKDLLMKMYLELKVRKKEEIEELSKEKKIEEKQDLKKLSLIELINYISNHINILIVIKSNLKYEEKMKKAKEAVEDDDSSDKKTLAKQYEELLIKAENDIRKHIKVSNYYLTIFYNIYI